MATPPNRRWRVLGRQWLDCVYPRRCVSCAEPVPATVELRHVCPDCTKRLVPIFPACPICGGPEGDGPLSPCLRCLETDPPYERGLSGFAYHGVARDLVHELKYRDGRYLAPEFRHLFGQIHGLAEFCEGALLVPVPMHPWRRWQRGFSQSLWLARQLCHVCPTARVWNVLRRTRATPSQTRLDRAARLLNLTGAIGPARRPPPPPLSDAAPCLVVDDVFTTGATATACALALRALGRQSVGILSFAHG